MNRLCLFLCLTVPTALLADAPKATLGETFQVEKHLNIPYRTGKEADPDRHKLDVYVPKGQKDYPVLMFVHGGSWKSGSKDLYPALGETFAKQGIGTVIINYRLSKPENKIKHPDHIHDVAAAFAWTKTNIGKYQGNVQKIYISGHSAGGHLVALLATDPKYLEAEKCSVADIRGVMALSGVYTVAPIAPVFTLPFGDDQSVCKAASPITHVKANHPKFLVAYADKDFPTLDKMAEDFGAKLKDCKCDTKICKIENRNHFSIIINLAGSSDDPLTMEMLNFIGK